MAQHRSVYIDCVINNYVIVCDIASATRVVRRSTCLNRYLGERCSAEPGAEELPNAVSIHLLALTTLSFRFYP